MLPSRRGRRQSEAERAVGAAARAGAREAGARPPAPVRARVREAARENPAAVLAALWPHLEHREAPRRLAAARLADELVGRSKTFRHRLAAELRRWADACVGSNADRPMPPASDALKRAARAMLLRWHRRYVPDPLPASTADYRRQIDIVFRHLQEKRGIVFDPAEDDEPNEGEQAPPPAPTLLTVDDEQVEQRRMAARRATALAELQADAQGLEMALSEAENGLSVLFPTFEEQFDMPDKAADMELLALPDFNDDNDDNDDDNLFGDKDGGDGGDGGEKKRQKVQQDEEEWESPSSNAPEDPVQGVPTSAYSIDISIQTKASGDDGAGRAVKEALLQLRRTYLDRLHRWVELLPENEQAASWLARARAVMEQADQLMMN